MGHATACAAALAVQHVIDADHLLENVVARGEQLRAELHSALDNHPYVGDNRCRGLFVVVEFVHAKPTQKPPDPPLQTHPRIKTAHVRNALLNYHSTTPIDPTCPDPPPLPPPFPSPQP